MRNLLRPLVAILIIVAHIPASAEHVQNNRGGVTFFDRFASFQTICAGRFLIDIPKDFSFSYGATRISGVQISSDAFETRAEFDRRVVERKDQLAAIKDENDIASLERVSNIEMRDVIGKVFLFGRKRSYLIKYGKKVESEWFSIEALVRVQNTSYRLFVEFGDERSVKKVDEIIANLRQRKNDEVPEQEGFCFDNGVVLGTMRAPELFESTVLFAGHVDYPDLAIALSSMSGVTRQKSLLQRSAENTVRQQYPSAFQKIYEGRRALAAIPGEESSVKVKEKKGTRSYSYMWESDSVKNDVKKPFLSLELRTGIGRPGEPVDSSLSEIEAQALWDTILNSLRLRPVLPWFTMDEPVTQQPDRVDTQR